MRLSISAAAVILMSAVSLARSEADRRGEPISLGCRSTGSFTYGDVGTVAASSAVGVDGGLIRIVPGKSAGSCSVERSIIEGKSYYTVVIRATDVFFEKASRVAFYPGSDGGGFDEVHAMEKFSLSGFWIDGVDLKGLTSDVRVKPLSGRNYRVEMLFVR